MDWIYWERNDVLFLYHPFDDALVGRLRPFITSQINWKLAFLFNSSGRSVGCDIGRYKLAQSLSTSSLIELGIDGRKFDFWENGVHRFGLAFGIRADARDLWNSGIENNLLPKFY